MERLVAGETDIAESAESFRIEHAAECHKELPRTPDPHEIVEMRFDIRYAGELVRERHEAFVETLIRWYQMHN